MLKLDKRLAAFLVSKDGADFVKRPVTVRAVRMDVYFTVPTMEGVMKGKAGDFLIRGVKGEFYPCDAEIFKETYEEA